MNDWGHSTLGFGPVGDEARRKAQSPDPDSPVVPAAPEPRSALDEVLDPGAGSRPGFQGSGLAVQRLVCPNCGEPFSTLTPGVKAIGCSSCGSIIDLAAMGVLGKVDPLGHEPWSHIRLGMNCRFKAVEYQTVGRIRYQSGEWFWDEWLLLSRKGKTLWLVEDEGKFFLLDSFLPDGEPDVDAAWSENYVEWEKGCRALVYEASTARIIHVEGELTWKAVVGESIRFVDAKFRGVKYSCEIEDDEIKFFRGRHYSAAQVYDAYGISDPVPYHPPEDMSDVDEDDYTVNWSAVPDSLTDLMKVLLLAGLIFFFVGLFFQNDGVPIAGSAIGGNVVDLHRNGQSDVFTLDRLGEIYAVSCRAQLTRSPETWAEMEAALVDAETGEPVLVFQREFWLESGRDSDGEWTESDTGHMEYFKLDHPGEFRLQLDMESNRPDSSVHAVLRRGARDRSLLFWHGVVFLGLAVLLFFAAARWYRERKDAW